MSIVEEDFGHVSSCQAMGSSGSEVELSTRVRDLSPMREHVGEPITLDLDVIDTPQEVLQVLVAMDRSSNALSTDVYGPEAICYEFEVNWVYDAYLEEDIFGDWQGDIYYEARYAPSLEIMVLVEGKRFFC